MYKYALLLLCLFINAVNAEELAPTFTDINQRLVKDQAMHGAFTQQKKITILKRPLRSSGQFAVDKTLGILWRTEKPTQSQLVISDDDVVFTEQVSDRVGRSMRYIGKILNAILSGDLAAIEKTFVVSNIQLTDKQWRLNLVPKSLLMKKALSSIELAGASSVEEITLKEKNGDYTHIALSNIQHADVLPSAIQAFYQK